MPSTTPEGSAWPTGGCANLARCDATCSGDATGSPFAVCDTVIGAWSAISGSCTPSELLSATEKRSGTRQHWHLLRHLLRICSYCWPAAYSQSFSVVTQCVHVPVRLQGGWWGGSRREGGGLFGRVCVWVHMHVRLLVCAPLCMQASSLERARVHVCSCAFTCLCVRACLFCVYMPVACKCARVRVRVRVGRCVL